MTGQDVDCVIVGRNCAHTLARCIESVKSVEYTRGEVRVIYVDGGSADGSVALAKGYDGVEVVEMAGTPNMGAVATRVGEREADRWFSLWRVIRRLRLIGFRWRRRG